MPAHTSVTGIAPSSAAPQTIVHRHPGLPPSTTPPPATAHVHTTFPHVRHAYPAPLNVPPRYNPHYVHVRTPGFFSSARNYTPALGGVGVFLAVAGIIAGFFLLAAGVPLLVAGLVLAVGCAIAYQNSRPCQVSIAR